MLAWVSFVCGAAWRFTCGANNDSVTLDEMWGWPQQSVDLSRLSAGARVLSTRSADAVPQCRQLGYAAVSLSIRARHERHLHV
ncbi:hypothetical protein XHV734_1651 [Xanthomonas hortorum pv. vitians]|nr:hypothetical protein XHV734_1651 [Xanthomonas hortorum pv. vitians]